MRPSFTLVVEAALLVGLGVGCRPGPVRKDDSLRVTAVRPDQASLSGGTTLRIFGEGFEPGAVVEIDGRTLEDLVVVSRREIRGRVPAGRATGTVELVVRVGRRVVTLPVALSYGLDAMAITSISPPHGVRAGRTPVRISGFGFLPTTVVRIGGLGLLDPVFVSSTLILGRSPGSPFIGQVDVTAEDPGRLVRLSAAFTYFDSPVSILDPTPAASGAHGSALAWGDFDGDGDRDLAVGTPRGNANRGEVHVYFSDGIGTFPARTILTDAAGANGDRFGLSLASGAFNRDGLADLLVGAPLANGAGVDRGKALVFLSNGGGGFPAVVTLVDPVPEDDAEFGHAVAAGDVDADGDADAIVSARLADVGASANAGEVFRFLSNGVGGFGAAATITEPVVQAGAQFGFSLETARFDAGGAVDLAVGVRVATAGALNSGEVIVFFADGLGGFGANLSLLDPTPEVSAAFGHSLAAGDVDADGDADLLVGVPQADPGAVANAGEAILFRSSGVGAFGAGLSIRETVLDGGAEFGTAVELADSDGASFADAIVGAPLGAAGGEVHVFRSTGSGGFFAPVVRVEPAQQAGAQFGGAVAADDANRDGFADLAIGAPGATDGGLAAAGEAFVFYGPN